MPSLTPPAAAFALEDGDVAMDAPLDIVPIADGHLALAVVAGDNERVAVGSGGLVSQDAIRLVQNLVH